MKIAIRRYAQIAVRVGEGENSAVQIAAENLLRDFRRVLDVHTYEDSLPAVLRVEIHTLDTGWRPADPEVRTDRLQSADGRLRTEGYLIQAVIPGVGVDAGSSAAGIGLPGSDGASADGKEMAGRPAVVPEEAWRAERPVPAVLYIIGTDRRGTVFGIYDFCRKVLGVSPWYFFADVPVRRKEEILLDTKRPMADWPVVEYRGFFINDEEELNHWAQRYLGEKTIGYRTYEKVFELALRLKMNYIWPAMHVNSFNMQPDCGALADRMGIVIGTSHCDMLMRSNHREWQPWLEKKGYTGVKYDYSVPGRNREILKEYWAESVDQNRNYECCYTLGMRGIHDSGFETEAFAGLQGEELRRAKIDLLESVIGAQEQILRDHLGHDTLKTFIPYKEVLDLYDHGLKVPDDLTLIWVNDNYGYVRRYPDAQEQKRPGGNGLYYHNSYWAAPDDEASYTFISTIPLSHTRNELKKAYDNGIRKIWVTNFGAIKPLEMELSFYADYAWDCGKKYVPEDDEEAWLEDWIDENFSGHHGVDLAQFLLLFDQVTNTRKLEQMVPDAFSQTTNGDEAAARMHIYEVIFGKANEVYGQLPEEEKDAFFELILMRIHAAYETNGMFYYADRSNLHMEQGKYADAGRDAAKAEAFGRARRSMLYYYNHVMAGGKWNGMVTPDDFAPPRSPSDPPVMRPLYLPVKAVSAEEAARQADTHHTSGRPQQRYTLAAGAFSTHENHLVVTLPNGADPQMEGLTYVKPASKWVEVANAGDQTVQIRITHPSWILLPDLEDPDGQQEGAGQDTENSRNPEMEAAWGNQDAAEASEDGAGKDTVVLTLTQERRILVELDWNQVAPELQRNRYEEGEIVISCAQAGETRRVRVTALLASNAIMPTNGDFETFFAHFEDDGMICVEAQDARELMAVHAANEKVRTTDRNLGIAQKNLGEGTGWNVIPNLGRMRGPLIEAKDPGAVLTYGFTNCVAGDATLELHRFPTLNSTGEISVDVRVDDGDFCRMCTESNDAYRGSWLSNVKDGVDRMRLVIPDLPAGTHSLQIRSVQPYFAFPRFVIYTGKIRKNSLGLTFYDPFLGTLPEEFDAEGFAKKFYGEEAAAGEPEPVVYLNEVPAENANNSNDYYAPGRSAAGPDAASEDSVPVTPAEIVYGIHADGALPADDNPADSRIPAERDGSLLIEAASALRQDETVGMEPSGLEKTGSGSDGMSSDGAHGSDGPADEAEGSLSGERRENVSWRWADAPSHAGSGLSMYLRRAGLYYDDPSVAPSLHYRVRVSGGRYRIWVRVLYWGHKSAHFTIGIDGGVIPEKELYGGQQFWNYSGENVWEWVPVYTTDLTAGEHEIRFIMMAGQTRVAQIYLTGNGNRPPASL